MQRWARMHASTSCRHISSKRFLTFGMGWCKMKILSFIMKIFVGFVAVCDNNMLLCEEMIWIEKVVFFSSFMHACSGSWKIKYKISDGATVCYAPFKSWSYNRKLSWNWRRCVGYKNSCALCTNTFGMLPLKRRIPLDHI